LVAPGVSEEDINIIRAQVARSQIKTEKLHSAADGLFAFKTSKGGRAICTTEKDKLIVLQVDPEHKYKNLSSIKYRT
jgi:hypothetical protein